MVKACYNPCFLMSPAVDFVKNQKICLLKDYYRGVVGFYSTNR